MMALLKTTYCRIFQVTLAFCFVTCSSPNEVPASKLTSASVDSAFTICKDVYFWSDSIPEKEKIVPLMFESVENLLIGIRSFSNKHQNVLLDRWSVSVKKDVWENYKNNVMTGFGLNFQFDSENDLRVKLIHNKSQAFTLGIRRGTKILKVDNIDATITNRDIIQEKISKSEVNISFSDENQKINLINLTKFTFSKESIINSKIINSSIGYFYLDGFSGENITTNQIKKLFNDFKQNNIKELIIDLRYNGGGDVFLAYEVANYIVPLTENHKIFSRFINNKKYGLLNYSLHLEAKQDNLNLMRVFFITSPETASASEVLINSLQAVMQVKVVGTQSHGKPFGFSPIAIGDFYIFPVAFTTINANGYGEYYDGIPVDFEVEDDVTHDFGDPEESCVQSILKYISSGQFPTSGKKGGRQNIERYSINENQTPAFMYISH